MKKLSGKEEAIMESFWKNGPLFLRELLEIQEEPRPHYNTLFTMVKMLEEKGYVGHKVFGNTYQYFPLISRKEYRTGTLGLIVDKYFNNSFGRVVTSFVEEDKISVDELQALIEQIKKQKK